MKNTYTKHLTDVAPSYYTLGLQGPSAVSIGIHHYTANLSWETIFIRDHLSWKATIFWCKVIEQNWSSKMASLAKKCSLKTHGLGDMFNSIEMSNLILPGMRSFKTGDLSWQWLLKTDFTTYVNTTEPILQTTCLERSWFVSGGRWSFKTTSNLHITNTTACTSGLRYWG